MSVATPQEMFAVADAPVITVDALRAIWSRVLRFAPIVDDDNFFDLGGDSLLALKMFLEVEEACGRKLPITAIYDAPTIGDLAALIETGVPEEFSPLVLLKSGSEPPLFIFHGIGGTVIEFAQIGSLIDAPNAVYAVQARGIDGSAPPLESFDAMVRYYKDEIKTVQSEGPYLLAGYSFGGLLAIELATQLKEQGDKVGLVLMIDAYAHPDTWPRNARLRMQLRKAMHRIVTSPGEAAGVLIKIALRLRKSSHGDAALPQTGAVPKKKQWPGEVDPNLPSPLREVREAGGVALYAHKPRDYPGDIVFLRASETELVYPASARAIWQHRVRKMTLRSLPGNHISLIRDHSAEVAAEISKILRQV